MKDEHGLDEADYALVARCCASVCFYCGNDKWMAASWDDGDYYHQPKRGKADAVWCESNAIWHEIWDDPQDDSPETIKDGTDASHH